MSSYDSYVSKIEKIAKVKNFVVKHKIPFIVGAGIVAALTTSFVSTKGIIVQDIVLPDKIVYGSDFEFEKEAIGLFGSEIYYEYRLEGEDWSTQKPLKPGHYNVRAVSTNSFGGKIYGNEVSFEIGRKDITFVINDSIIPYGDYENISYSIYDGTPDDKDIYSKGLVGSDSIYTIDFEFEDTSKNSTMCRVEQESVTIINQDGNDVSALYKVHTVYKDITFAKRDIVLEPELVNKVYDGTPIEYNNEYTSSTAKDIAKGDTLTIYTSIEDKNGDELEELPIEAGSYLNSIDSFKIVNSKGDDVTVNYNIKYKPNYLVISKRDITIQAGSSERVYDGTTLSNYDYESIVSGSLVENEYIVYDSSKETEFPSMKDVYYVDGLVSSIENKIKYLITDGTKDKSKNYNITVLPGELKILPLELNITPLEQESFVYNGEKVEYSKEKNNFHEVNGVSLPEGVELNVKVYYELYDDLELFSPLDSVMDAGPYAINIKSYSIINDLESNYIINTMPTYFDIYKRDVTVSIINLDDCEYDGNGFAYDGLSYNITSPLGFVDGEKIKVIAKYSADGVNFSTSQPRNAGTYYVKLDSFEFMLNAKEKNYNITLLDTIEEFDILPRTISIYANSLPNAIYNKTIQDTYDKNSLLYDKGSKTIVTEDKFSVSVDYRYLDGNIEILQNPKNAGDYRIYISSINFEDEINAGNYNILYSKGKYGEYRIEPRSVYIKANDMESIIYDGNNHSEYDSTSYTLLNDTSFVEGDGVLVSPKFYLENKVDDANNVIEPRNAGTYYIFIDSFEYTNETMNGNYSVIINDLEGTGGIFTINKRKVTIKAVDVESSVYNGKIQDYYDINDYTYENDSLEIVDKATVSYRYINDENNDAITLNAYKYGILLNGISFEDENNLNNYIINYSTEKGWYEILKKDLLITSVDKEIIYGQEFVDKEVSYTGFVEGEDESVLNGTLSISTSYNKYDNVGSYPIISSGLMGDNYDITYEEGLLTVSKATLVNKTENLDIVYDGKEHFLTFEFDGLVSKNSDYPSDRIEELDQIINISLDGSSYSTEYEMFKNACEITTIYYILSFRNYKDINSSNTIKINKRDLTIKASDKTITFGEEFTLSEYEATGWAEGEDISVLEGKLSFVVNYNQFDDIDPSTDYKIYVEGCTSNNYNIEYVPGRLTILKATLTDASMNYEGTYDGNEHGILISAVGFLKGEIFSEVATIKYSLVEDGEYTSENIKLINHTPDPVVVYYIITFANYNDIRDFKTIKINKAILTVTPKEHTIQYGEEPSNDGLSFRGFVNDTEDESLLSISSAVYSYSYTKYDDVGDYEISVSNIPDTLNYHIVYEKGILHVIPRFVDVIWGSTTLTYNGKVQAPSASVVTCNEDECIVTLNIPSTNKDVNDNVGDPKYIAYAVSLSNPNYQLGENTSIEYIITKAQLDISPSEKRIEYGKDFDLSDVHLLFNGFVNNEDINVLDIVDVEDKFYTNYVKFAPVEDSLTHEEILYYIEIYDGWISAKNYSITFKTSRLYVSKAELIDESKGYEGVYDGCDHSITLKFSKFLNDDSEATQKQIVSYKLEGDTSYDLDNPMIKNYTGEEGIKVYYRVTFINYKTIESYKTVIIKQKSITITANDCSISYGSNAMNNGVRVNEDDLVVVNGIRETIEVHLNNLEGLSFTYFYNTFDNVGTYDIIPSGLSSLNNNYKFVYVNGKLNVVQKEIDVIWDENDSLSYNGLSQIINVSILGLVNSDTCDVLFSNNSYGIEVNSYTAKIIGISNDNYCLKPSQVTEKVYNIIKANLIIKANDVSITYGEDPESAFDMENGVTYEGFVNGEDQTVLSGTLVLSTIDYNRYDDVGTYKIIPSGLTSSNYEIVYKEGDFVVNQLEATISWSENDEFTYDGNEHCIEAVISNPVNGDECSLTIEGKKKNAGTYVATAIAIVGAKSKNYKLPSNVTASFTILKKELIDKTENLEFVYDGDNHYINVVLEGFIESEKDEDFAINLPVQYSINGFSWSNTNIGFIHVSNSTSGAVYDETSNGHPIFYRAEFDNYYINYSNGSYNTRYVKITPKTLTDVTEDINVTYDSLEHSISLSLTGFVVGASEYLEAKVDKIRYYYNDSIQLNNPKFKNVGEYEVKYELTFKNADYYPLSGTKTIIITRADAIDQSIGFEDVYNGSAHGISVYAGLCGDDVFNSLATIKYSLVEDGEYTSENIKLINHTPDPVVVYYIITFANYNDIRGFKTINILQRDLFVYSNNVTITYGDNPEGNGIYFGNDPENPNKSGFFGSENENTVIDRSNLSYSFDYSQFDDVGTYKFRANGLLPKVPAKDNYNFIYIDADLTVNKKEITVDWENTVFTYNGYTQYPTPIASGFVNGDSFDLEAYVSEESLLPIRAGNYIAFARFNSEVKNYSIPNNNSVDFVINKLAISLKPNETINPLTNVSKIYDGLCYEYDVNNPGNYEISDTENAKIGHSNEDKITIYVKYLLNDIEINGNPKDVGTYKVVIDSFVVTHLEGEDNVDYTDCYILNQSAEVLYVIGCLDIIIEANNMDEFTFDGQQHYYPSNSKNYNIVPSIDSQLETRIANELDFTVYAKFILSGTSAKLDSIRNVGTYSIKIEYDNHSSKNLNIRYYEESTASVTINPKEYEIDLEDKTVTYNGKKFIYEDILLLDGDKLVLNVIYNKIKNSSGISDNQNNVDAINAGLYEMTLSESNNWYSLSLTERSIVENYEINLVSSSVSKQLVIQKRDVYIMTEYQDSAIYDGSEHTYKGSFVYYGDSENNINNQFIEGEILELAVFINNEDGSRAQPINAGTYYVVIDKDSTKIKVQGQEDKLSVLENYEVHNEYSSKFIVKKRKVGLLPIAYDDKIYDNETLSAYQTGYGNFRYDKNISSFELVEGEELSVVVNFYLDLSIVELENVINAGTYSYNVSVDSINNLNMNNYEFICNNLSLTISRRTVYISPLQIESIEYDRLEHQYSDYKDDSYQYYGLSVSDSKYQIANGETLSIVVFFGDSLCVVNSGRYNMIIDNDSSTITRGENVYNASVNYNIVTYTGNEYVFEIRPRELTISAVNKESVYDGNVYEYVAYTSENITTDFIVNGLIEGDEDNISVIKFIYKQGENIVNPINVGTYDIVLDVDNCEISTNYSLKIDPTESPTLTILKRKITISIKSLSYTYVNKVYDSSYNEYVVYYTDEPSLSGFVNEDDKNAFSLIKYIYSVDDKVVDPINAGTYSISLEYEFTDITVKNNYEVYEIIEGQLSILKRKVTVMPKFDDEIKTYDGQAYVYPVEEDNYILKENSLDVCEGHILTIKVAFDHAVATGLYNETINLHKLFGSECFYDKVTEAATYKASAYMYLINGKENENYEFHSEYVDFSIQKRNILLYNGDFEFIYNGSEQSLHDLVNKEINYVNSPIDNEDTVQFLSLLHYKVFVDTSEDMEKFIDVAWNEEIMGVSSYVNNAYLRLFKDDIDRTYNFEVEIEKGSITILPKDVNFIIDVPEEDATTIFTGLAFEFFEDNFRIETLCDGQILKINSWNTLAEGIIRTGTYSINDIDYTSIEFVILKDDILVSCYNYTINYVMIRDIVINKAHLDFTINNAQKEYCGEIIPINEFLNPINAEGAFELENSKISIEDNVPTIFYYFDDSSNRDRVFEIKDAGVYQVSIYYYDLVIYGETRNRDFDFDYDNGKLEFEITITQYDFKQKMKIVTGSSIVPFIYDINNEQEAYSRDYSCNLDEVFTNKGFTTDYAEKFYIRDYTVYRPKEEALLNTLPIIIIDPDGNNVTRNFLCSKQNDYGEWVIDYESPTIVAEVGLINIDSKMTLIYENKDSAKKYDGKNLVFEGNYIVGQLYNSESQFSNLYFKAEIHKIHYRRGSISYELTGNQGICLVGEYIVVVKNIQAYVNSNYVIKLPDDYYISYNNYKDEEDAVYIEGNDSLYVCKLNIVQRDIYIKPVDLVDVYYDGNVIEATEWEPVGDAINDTSKQVVPGHTIDIETTIKIDLESIHNYIVKTTKNTIDASKTKIYDEDGNDVTFCYKIISTATEGNKAEAYKYYGKITLAKRYIVILPHGNVDSPHIYDGEYIYNTGFDYISRYQNATEVSSLCTERSYGLLENHVMIPYEMSPCIANVGTKFNKLVFDIRDETGGSVSSIYKIVYRDDPSAYLVVAPREIIIRTGSKSVSYYEGMEPVTCHEFTVENLLEGHYIDENKIVWEATLDKPGRINNSISINLSKSNKAILDKYNTVVSTNYTIKYIYGSLIVS